VRASDFGAPQNGADDDMRFEARGMVHYALVAERDGESLSPAGAAMGGGAEKACQHEGERAR
jgi:hypothetical protein